MHDDSSRTRHLGELLPYVHAETIREAPPGGASVNAVADRRNRGVENAFVEDAWPNPATHPEATPRLALKLGLLLLWSAKVEQARALSESRSSAHLRPAPRAAFRATPERWVDARQTGLGSDAPLSNHFGGMLSLIHGLRELLGGGVTGVGLVETGQSSWLNWQGPYATDAERIIGWTSPGDYRHSPLSRSAAGRVHECELDLAMLLIGLVMRDLESPLWAAEVERFVPRRR